MLSIWFGRKVKGDICFTVDEMDGLCMYDTTFTTVERVMTLGDDIDKQLYSPSSLYGGYVGLNPKSVAIKEL